MIGRIWHGWTTPANADAYERLLREELFPTFAAEAGEGYRGAHLLRRAQEAEVAFKTILWFDSLEAVQQFAGADYRRAHVPGEARALLSRFDDHAQHYELRAHQRRG